jgi:hypothetical protein
MFKSVACARTLLALAFFASPLVHARGVGDGGGTGARVAQCRVLSSNQGGGQISLILSYTDIPDATIGIQAGLYQEVPNGARILLLRRVRQVPTDPATHLLRRFVNDAAEPGFALSISDQKISETEYRADLSDTVLDDGAPFRAELACETTGL